MPSLLAQLGDARDEVMKMDWVSIAKTMTTEDVAALAKGLGLAESRLRWFGGSVAPVIWVFRELQRRDPGTAEAAAEWIGTRWVEAGYDNYWAHFPGAQELRRRRQIREAANANDAIEDDLRRGWGALAWERYKQNWLVHVCSVAGGRRRTLGSRSSAVSLAVGGNIQHASQYVTKPYGLLRVEEDGAVIATVAVKDSDLLRRFSAVEKWRPGFIAREVELRERFGLDRPWDDLAAAPQIVRRHRGMVAGAPAWAKNDSALLVDPAFKGDDLTGALGEAMDMMTTLDAGHDYLGRKRSSFWCACYSSADGSGQPFVVLPASSVLGKPIRLLFSSMGRAASVHMIQNMYTI